MHDSWLKGFLVAARDSTPNCLQPIYIYLLLSTVGLEFGLSYRIKLCLVVGIVWGLHLYSIIQQGYLDFWELAINKTSASTAPSNLKQISGLLVKCICKATNCVNIWRIFILSVFNVGNRGIKTSKAPVKERHRCCSIRPEQILNVFSCLKTWKFCYCWASWEITMAISSFPPAFSCYSHQTSKYSSNSACIRK